MTDTSLTSAQPVNAPVQNGAKPESPKAATAGVATEQKRVVGEVVVGGLVASAPAVKPETVKLPDQFVNQSNKLLRQLKVAAKNTPDENMISGMELLVSKISMEARKEDLKYFYDQVKSEIKVGKQYEWLSNSKAVWKFNPLGDNEFDVIVPVCDIYVRSVALKQAKLDELKDQPTIAKARDTTVVLPDSILLHLYRVFETLEEQKEMKDYLATEVGLIEVRLGIKPATAPPAAQSNGLVSGEALEFMTKAPTMAMGIMKDPRAQKTIADIGEKLNGASTVNEAIASILSLVQQDDFKSVISETVEKVIPGVKIPDGLMQKGN